MAPAATISTVQYTLFRLYGRGLAKTVLRDHPTLARIAKRNKFKGEDFRYKVKFGNNQGIGSTLSLAKSHAGSNKGLEFSATRKTRYGVMQLSGEAIQAATDEGAIVDSVIDHTESIGEELIDSLAFDLFRDGTGIRGQIASISGNTITLKEPYSARNFKLGMTIGASTGATGLTGVRVGTAKVDAIGEDDGKITLDNIATIAAIANNDFLFREGDPGTCMTGMQVCTPVVAPVLGSDSFRGQDRGRYPVMLAGTRIVDSSTDPDVLWGNAAVTVFTRAGRLREVVTNPITFHTVQKQQNAKVMYTNAGNGVDVGFEYMTIHTGGGQLRVFADPNCPLLEDRLWDPDTHYIRHLNELPHLVKDDGNTSMRMTDDDGVEWRWRQWGDYIQENPARHAVVYRG